MRNRFFAKVPVILCLLAGNSADLAAEAGSDKTNALIDKLELQVVGNVFDRDTNALIYREFHYWHAADNRHLVLYRDPEGRLIAEKLLDGEISLVSPEISQSNLLSGETTNIVYDNKNAQFTVAYKESSESKTKKEIVKVGSDSVVDAGFNHYLVKHWEAFSVETKKEFDYLVPSRQSFYRFFAQEVNCETEGKNDAEWRCVKVAPTSWWLRRFVEPINLTYDRQTRTLINYSGLGNISDEQGNFPEIQINYHYP